MEKTYQNYKRIKSINPIYLLLALVIGVMFLFWVIKMVVFKVMAWLAPFFLVAALIMNYKVVQGYVLWLWNNLRNNTKFGLIVTALSVVFFPVVTAYLAFRAYHLRGTKTETKSEPEGEYIKYTEVENEDFLDISIEKEKAKNISEDYSDLI